MDEGALRIEAMLAESGWLYDLSRALVRSDDRAWDVVQETWRAGIQGPPHRPGPLRGWLATVARNAARQILRRERRLREREHAVARPEAAPDAGEAVERMELRRLIATAVTELPEPCRTAVVLRYFEDATPRAIAARLGVPAATVRSRIHRGVALLRKRLDRGQPGGRTAWLSVLSPLLRRYHSPSAASAGAPTVLTGALIMSAKAKLALTIALVLLFCGGMWQLVSHDGGGRAGPGSGSPTPPPLSREPGNGAEAGEEDTEAPAAPGGLPAQARGELAANDRISGRVQREDGSPVPGFVVVSGFTGGLFRVEHGSCFAVTDSEGRFSFPAVRGAPYAVYPLAGQPGLLGITGSTHRRVPGGTTDVTFVLRSGGALVIRTEDYDTGEPVPVTGCGLRWSGEGRTRSGFVQSLAYRLGKRTPAPGYEPPPDDLLRLPIASVTPIGLPPAADVDPGTAVTIRMYPRDERWEPAVTEVARRNLDRDLGVEVVRLRRLPERGFTLRVLASHEGGEPVDGEGKLTVYRDGVDVQQADFRVTGGEAQVERLALGADRVSVRVEGASATLTDCPVAEGAAAEISLVVPRRWTLVVDPIFDGEPRRMRVTWTRPGRGVLRVFTTGKWPHVLHGESPESASLAFFAEDEKVGEEAVELAPGEKVVVRPRLPGGKPAGEAPGSGPPVAVEAPEPEPPPLPPGGPGVLVGRAVFPGGAIPEPFPVQLGRWSEPGDSPDTPSWWETTSETDGSFRFEGLPPGRYELWARPSGSTARRMLFTVPEDGRIEPVEVQFGGTGEIVVVVRGPAGEPMAGEEVGVSPQGVGVSGRAGLHAARTDEEGRARFTGLNPGGWRATWIPEGGSEMNRATNVRAEEVSTVTFDNASSGALTGRVLPPRGAPPLKALVRLRGAGQAHFEAETDRDGGYRFPSVPAGEYRVGFQLLDLPGYTCPLGQVRILAGDERTVDFQVPDTRIAGRILRADTGEPLARDQVQLSVSRTVDGGFEHAMCWVAEGGKFVFLGLRPGTWNFTASPMVGGLEMVRRALVLPESGRLEDLEVVLPAR